MDEELQGLIRIYELFLIGSQIDKNFMIERLIADRADTYRWDVGVCDAQDIKTEVNEYLKLLKELTKVYDVRSEKFSQILNAISHTHSPLGYYLTMPEMSEIISLELEALADIRKELKKHPHRAGMRIKDIDVEMNLLQEKKAKMLGESELAD